MRCGGSRRRSSCRSWAARIRLRTTGGGGSARARINIPFGTSLTAAARLPENADRSLADPFAEKKLPWKLYLVLATLLAAALVLWRQGYLAQWFGM